MPLAALEAFEEGRGNITAAALDRVADVLAVDAGALRQGKIERSPTAALFFLQSAFGDFRDIEDRPKIMEAFERALALRKVNALLGRPASLREQFEPEEPTPESARMGIVSPVRSAARWETRLAPSETWPSCSKSSSTFWCVPRRYRALGSTRSR